MNSPRKMLKKEQLSPWWVQFSAHKWVCLVILTDIQSSVLATRVPTVHLFIEAKIRIFKEEDSVLIAPNCN